MNLHIPISAFNMAEIGLMSAVPMHVMSPKTSSPIIAVVQDVPLGVHVITLPGVRIDATNMMNSMASLPRFDGRVPRPVAHGPSGAEAWSDRQALSAVIPSTVNATLTAAVRDKVRVTRGRFGEEGGALIKGVIIQINTKGRRSAWGCRTRPWTLKEIDGKLKKAERGVSDMIAKIYGKGWKPKASLNTPVEDMENKINIQPPQRHHEGARKE
eukprot:jgi/Tetstr1/453342/TSEL_040333.t1